MWGFSHQHCGSGTLILLNFTRGDWGSEKLGNLYKDTQHSAAGISQIFHLNLDPGLVSLWPMGQIWPTACFVNKVLLETGHTHLYVCCLWLLVHRLCDCLACGAEIHTIWSFFPPFWLHHATGGILVPQPGIKPMTPALEARSSNLWTTRELIYCLVLYRSCSPLLQALCSQLAFISCSSMYQDCQGWWFQCTGLICSLILARGGEAISCGFLPLLGRCRSLRGAGVLITEYAYF